MVTYGSDRGWHFRLTSSSILLDRESFQSANPLAIHGDILNRSDFSCSTSRFWWYFRRTLFWHWRVWSNNLQTIVKFLPFYELNHFLIAAFKGFHVDSTTIKTGFWSKIWRKSSWSSLWWALRVFSRCLNTIFILAFWRFEKQTIQTSNVLLILWLKSDFITRVSFDSALRTWGFKLTLFHLINEFWSC